MKTINVTKQDIKCGKKSDSGRCPVARALKRAFPGKCFDVACTYLVMRKPTLKYYHLSQNVRCFIDRFDEGRPVKPFRFKFKL